MITVTIQAEDTEVLLTKLIEMGFRASGMLGVAQGPADTPAPEPEPAKPNGEAAPAAPPAGRRGKGRRDAPAPAAAAPPDREAIVKGLTEIYMRGEPATRERITQFRDGHGAVRLRDLKDEVLPEAESLLAELQAQESAGP